MKNHFIFTVLASAVVVVSAGSAACGSTDSETDPVVAPTVADPAPTAPVAAAPAAPPLDHGAVSTKYPAFAPAMGQIIDNGGGVLTAPVVVTVTWPNEPNLADLETLGDEIGASPYWSTGVSEYGVGPSTGGIHVRLTDAAPTSITDTALEQLVATNVANGTFPTPDTGQPIYIAYLQKGTSLLYNGKDACSQGIGGYHGSVAVNGVQVAYAIVPRCGKSFDNVTVAASHELAEAATDPYPNVRPAWVGFSSDDVAWEFFQQFQSENGDACEFYRDSDLIAGIESGLKVTVQRLWSNKSAAGGHDPCVPIFAGTTFFNVTPIGLEDIQVDASTLGGGTATTKGFNVPVGKTRTIPLGFYSDGPLKEWTIKAITGGIAGGGRSGVDLTLDTDTGANGQKAYLTISVTTAGRTGTELITIVSTRNGTSHYMPILIGSK